MGRLGLKAWALGCFGLSLLLLAAGADTWAQPLPDGLDVKVDENCRVIAGEWTILVIIDEPAPPPELIPLINGLEEAVQKHNLLDPYTPNWIIRLRAARDAVSSPRRWWRASAPSLRRTRKPRGLFDAVGHGFKFLFGTSTEDEVDDIRRVVSTLAAKQSRLFSVMDQFTTIINHTYDEIQTNRNQINLLSTGLQQLSRNLGDQMTHALHRIRVQEARTDVEVLLTQIEDATRRYITAHEAFIHRKENLEAGRLTENILPPDVLQSLLGRADNENAQFVSPIQWYYENSVVIPIWTDTHLIYRTRLPLVDPIAWHHVTVQKWPVPMKEWQATVILPDEVLRDTRTGELDVSPTCFGQRPRVCRRGLINRPNVHPCVARLLGKEPAYDPSCIVSMQRRLPVDVVYPQVFNTYILITGGTDLVLRCEGRAERSTTLQAGAYRLELEYPCSLHGDNWNLSPTFQRSINVTLDQRELPFEINTTFADWFKNSTDYDPLILDLGKMDDVDRKQIAFGDFLPQADMIPDWSGSNHTWHVIWPILVMIAVGVALFVWRRNRRRNYKPPTEIELEAATGPSTSSITPAIFKFLAEPEKDASEPTV